MRKYQLFNYHMQSNHAATESVYVEKSMLESSAEISSDYPVLKVHACQNAKCSIIIVSC